MEVNMNEDAYLDSYWEDQYESHWADAADDYNVWEEQQCFLDDESDGYEEW